MIEPVLLAQQKNDLSALEQRINKYNRFFARQWRSALQQAPVSGTAIGYWEKRRREKHFKMFINQATTLSRQREQFLAQPEKQEQIFSAVQNFLSKAVGMSAQHLALLMSADFKNSTTEFVNMAREFDAGLSPADLFQACRNVWIMNGLQLLLGLEVKFSPAICAYSLLYPYTDNYLDDASISILDKASFNRRFRRRLMGESIPPINRHENSIFALVEIIERQFNRSLYPQVFDSLVAIQDAQAKSVDLIHKRGHISAEEVLAISLEKGGASVVADGYLVAGYLSEEQERFLYGYGAYLQFLDDLQDVNEDAACGQMTVYSGRSRAAYLDVPAEQTFSFGQKVMTLFPTDRSKAAKAYLDIIDRCVRLMLIEAICFAPEHFSQAFLRRIEKQSPCRFKVLRRLKEKHQPYYLAMFGKCV